MPDTPDTPDLPALAAFTPVPRLKDRSNGWKPQVQRAFIAALAETGSVKAACKRVGRSERGAYQLRREPGAAEFIAAWAAALAEVEAALPPPALGPMTMQELMLILRAHARRREATERAAGQDAEG